jgi:hypothetical protein
MKELSELNESRISIGIHSAVGVVAGYASVLFDNALYALGLAILILIITGYAVEFILKKKGIKWWMSNGGLVYILIWIVIWVFFFNLP